MRRVSRHDVVQAMGVLGVRISGVVERAHFEDARTQALAGVRALLIESHPDRHAASGHAQRATARAQEVSAAEHLLRSAAWFDMAHLFAVKRRSSSRTTVPRGGRFYKRCMRCGRVNPEGVEHHCGTRVDPAATHTRPGPRCGGRSPLGVICEEPPGHQGWHRGYGQRGRHTWRPWGFYADEAGERDP